MRTIKLIKNAERKIPETRSMIKSAARQHRLPKVVQSWVSEFKRNRRGESRIAFDNLFKDASSQSGQSD